MHSRYERIIIAVCALAAMALYAASISLDYIFFRAASLSMMPPASELLGQIEQDAACRRLGGREELVDERDVHGAGRRFAYVISSILARACSM